MDYSKFVDAVLNEDEEALKPLVQVISAVLMKFLRVRYRVSKQDAEDCAQSTLMIAVEVIRNGKLENRETIISYLFTTAKNEYFKLLSKNKESSYQSPDDYDFKPADQLDLLLTRERQAILEDCISALKADFQEYIRYWFQNTDSETAVVANHFGISVSNAWTKKHRIINLLRECYEKKIQL